MPKQSRLPHTRTVAARVVTKPVREPARERRTLLFHVTCDLDDLWLRYRGRAADVAALVQCLDALEALDAQHDTQWATEAVGSLAGYGPMPPHLPAAIARRLAAFTDPACWATIQ